jgi:hypothetical protein
MFATAKGGTGILGRSRAGAAALALGTVMALAAVAPAPAHEAHGHPARIHEGSCESLGAVALSLNGVGGSVDLDGAPVATPAAVNPDTTYQVMVSETTIDAPLETLLASDHAVMIYESDEEMQGISCGNIGGAMHGETLITGLAEIGIPGHLGFAIFQPQGEQTAVEIILGHAMAPVSASGVKADHEHNDAEAGENGHDDAEAGADHDEEDDHDATATPQA